MVIFDCDGVLVDTERLAVRTEAKILAGGLSLVPMMNFRLARPTALVDVTNKFPTASHARYAGGMERGVNVPERAGVPTMRSSAK